MDVDTLIDNIEITSIFVQSIYELEYSAILSINNLNNPITSS